MTDTARRPHRFAVEPLLVDRKGRIRPRHHMVARYRAIATAVSSAVLLGTLPSAVNSMIAANQQRFSDESRIRLLCLQDSAWTGQAARLTRGSAVGCSPVIRPCSRLGRVRRVRRGRSRQTGLGMQAPAPEHAPRWSRCRVPRDGTTDPQTNAESLRRPPDRLHRGPQSHRITIGSAATRFLR